MAHKTKREELLAAAKKRQAKRKKITAKLKSIQQDIPRKIPGVPPWVTAVARRPETVDISQAAFTQQVNEAANIVALEYLLEHMPAHQMPRSTFDPNNPITRLLQSLEFPERSPQARTPKQPRPPRPRTDPQLINDEIQSTAFTAANKMARKKDGSFKRGWDQRRVAMMAQKLGYC